MKAAERLKIWWRGHLPRITEIEGGGWRLTYQDPSYRTPRDRFLAAVRSSFVKWMFGTVMTGIVIGVIVLAIAKRLGL